MSSYLFKWLRSYPLKRLMWISSVYGPRMPVCTPYNICVAPDEMTAGLLRCKHKPHLCMLGPNATLIKSDSLGRNMHVSDLLLCCSSCCAASPVLQFSKEQLVVLLLGFCTLVAPNHLSWCISLPPCISSTPLTLWWGTQQTLWLCLVWMGPPVGGALVE